MCDDETACTQRAQIGEGTRNHGCLLAVAMTGGAAWWRQTYQGESGPVHYFCLGAVGDLVGSVMAIICATRL